jgi:plasmanylethanolamine desaturase
MEPVWITIQIFLIWLGADLLTGLVHWWQDTYGNPTWPIIGKYVVKPNLKHHDDPRAMLQVSYWNRCGASVVAGIVIIGILLLCNASWQAIVLFAFSSQGNEIHAMAHRTDKENGKIIMFLQKIGIVQRRRTHGWHHKAPYETNFCVMTEFLNPPLNRIGFFPKLERLIQKFGIKPLRGDPIRNGV